MNQRVAWTDEEIRHLREHHREATYKQIGKSLGRSTLSVTNKANKLGLSRGWTDQELAYLKEHYKNQPRRPSQRSEKAKAVLYKKRWNWVWLVNLLLKIV